ncbi:putative YigZ family protein [Streptosporangium becharense]|uniref:Putative YigZ family protein n=1 Tax=Streptosporangium becharense TaxID=1816182 RepID=A0A7W9ICD1_9ACTN|nr:YigZ family protein [Streptosporangium becharense]MBB2915427.1 putative YigZ family protein [Streptosporangium becharense]MBB5817614.1 putative YigZ family protein [Streptosporangium becharense]
MREPYLTPEDVTEHEIEIKRSRFLCAVGPARSEEEARRFVAGRRSLYGDATHNCSAYVIGGDRGIQRADDDGEPGGTAGTPMLETLLRRGLSDVVTVVTRYFGGVKLGAGGLVRAYGSSVGKTLDLTPLTEMVPARVMTVTVDHIRAGRLENDLRASPYEVREVVYGAEVGFRVAVREADLPTFPGWIATLTAGRAEIEAGEPVHLARE